MKRQHVIPVPKHLSLKGVLGFVPQLHALPKADEYLFDFGGVQWIPPFALLYISSEIQRCADRTPHGQFAVQNHTHMTYAAHMGFFQSFRVDFGNVPGDAPGSPTYIPITLFDTAELHAKAAAKAVDICDEIETKCRELAEMLTRTTVGPLVDTLTYALREIIRNVIEHSEAVQFAICAQYWPKKSSVEVAILDRGRGIRSSLGRNPHLAIANDREALTLALMPGISGAVFRGRRNKHRGVWENSGFGLYMTSRLCRNGGTFFIASGSTALKLDGDEKESFSFPFQGTALRLNVRTSSLQVLSCALDQYRREGGALAKAHLGTTHITASVASKMLSRDFKS